MNTEEIIKVKTTILRVNINCDGCEKRLKKTLHKIDGVYQSRIDAEQGKVMVSGLVDADTIIKKLRKVGKLATLWASNPDVVSEPQNLQADGGGQMEPEDASDKGQPKEACGKGQNGGPTMGIGGSLNGPVIGRSVDEGSRKDAKMPGQIPQQLQQLQQQMQQQQQMRGMKIPPQIMANKMSSSVTAAPAAQAKEPRSAKFNLHEDEFEDEGSEFDEFAEDEDFEGVEGREHKMTMMAKSMPQGRGASGGSIGGMKRGITNEIPVQIKGNASNTISGEKDITVKQSLGGVGTYENNRGHGQPLQNIKGGAMGSPNQQGPGMQGSIRPMMGGGAVGGPMGGMLPSQPGMRRPSNANMTGGSSFPHMGQVDGAPMNMPMGQTHMGGMPHPGGASMNKPIGHPYMGDMPQPGSAINGTSSSSMSGAGLYHGGNGVGGGGMAVRPEMVHHVATPRNPMAQQENMTMMQQHQHQYQHQHRQMMVNGYNGGHHGQGGIGYPPMGYGYSNHRPPMDYPRHAESSYNIFSDENPNGCSVM